MFTRSRTLRRLLNKWPGKKWFGVYRFLPIFYVAGAALEFSMIKWHVGEVNFYRVYKRNEVERLVKEKIREEQMLKAA